MSVGLENFFLPVTSSFLPLGITLKGAWKFSPTFSSFEILFFGLLTEMAVTWKRKVAKQIRRQESDHNTKGYKSYIKQKWGRVAKTKFWIEIRK